jgi:hypothetical protein
MCPDLFYCDCELEGRDAHQSHFPSNSFLIDRFISTYLGPESADTVCPDLFYCDRESEWPDATGVCRSKNMACDVKSPCSDGLKCDAELKVRCVSCAVCSLLFFCMLRYVCCFIAFTVSFVAFRLFVSFVCFVCLFHLFVSFFCFVCLFRLFVSFVCFICVMSVVRLRYVTKTLVINS